MSECWVDPGLRRRVEEDANPAGTPVEAPWRVPDDCPHGRPLHCVQCRTGREGIEADVADARLDVADDQAAMVVAEALVREAGMPYLDGLAPETAARVSVAALRCEGLL